MRRVWEGQRARDSEGSGRAEPPPPPQAAGRKELMVGALVLASPWKGDMSRFGCLKVTGVAVQGICPGASAEMGFKKDPRG